MAGGTGSQVPGVDANVRFGGSRAARTLAPALGATLTAIALLAPAARAETVYKPAPAPSIPAPPAQPPPGTPNTKLSGTRINAGHGTAQFSFAGVGAVTGFECALVKRVVERHGHRKKRHRHHRHPHHPPRHHKRVAFAAHPQRPSFRACSPPRAYRGLGSGHYLFKARAYGPGGFDATPARLRFTITRGSQRS